ncbi:hypothetical protein AS9A_4421 [Hoyosella subflava DQS3-9A1]|uniref:Uncharacterized protein n=1 Tax=Hoyosella subflava (strain DSM 45089 / JCM 17490 / NBRC 109087 / DQS3-9A1) TaxID=443218 RepID=F6EMW3_HOYSD|nr:hypothetical protein AS9A_4421 [Hoyosella subflava DQS3-9A1]
MRAVARQLAYAVPAFPAPPITEQHAVTGMDALNGISHGFDDARTLVPEDSGHGHLRLERQIGMTYPRSLDADQYFVRARFG